jgi:hypothetical protein
MVHNTEAVNYTEALEARPNDAPRPKTTVEERLARKRALNKAHKARQKARRKLERQMARLGLEDQSKASRKGMH